jgi:predicted transcriptional regulator
MEALRLDPSFNEVDYINAALAAVDRGEVVSHEKVKEWALSLKSDNPLPLPQSKK